MATIKRLSWALTGMNMPIKHNGGDGSGRCRYGQKAYLTGI